MRYLVSAVALLLVACGGADPDSSSNSPTAPALSSQSADPAGRTYSTIDELVADAVAAGITCPYIETPLRQRLSADSRYCSQRKGGDVTGLPTFDTFSTDADLEKARKEAIEFAKIDVEYGDQPNSILVGPNWLIGARLDELTAASEALGGVVQNLENVAVD